MNKPKLTLIAFLSAALLAVFYISDAQAYDCEDYLADNFWKTVDKTKMARCLELGLLDKTWHFDRPILEAAAGFGTPEIVEQLLQHGAFVGPNSTKGTTPLHAAATRGDDGEILLLLIKYGADVNARNIHGITPLHSAAFYEQNSAKAEILISNGATVAVEDKYGTSPIDNAFVSGSGELIEFLARAYVEETNDASGDIATVRKYLDEDDLESAIREIIPLVAREDGHAFFTMGIIFDHTKLNVRAASTYSSTSPGYVHNPEAAAYWYQRAASKGLPEAMNNLAVKYNRGELNGSRERQAEKAAELFRAAAEKGASIAQFNLATMYFEGRGVPQDYQLAHVWFSIALKNGYKDARLKRNQAEEHLSARLVEESLQFVQDCIGSNYSDCL